MENNESYIHPINQYGNKIKENGIVVFDDIRGLPTGDKPFISPDYVICIGHRGHIDLMYDDIEDYSEQYTVGVIFPDHRIVATKKTDDYLSSLIIVDSSLLNDPMLKIIDHLRYRYEPHPCIKLDKHEYRKIMNVVEIMRETSTIGIQDKQILMERQLEFLLRLLSYYRSIKLNETNADKRVSIQFLNDLALFYREHHNVGFYVERACLSPKYFSTIIKKETGHTASYWIHTKIVSEAKNLLHMRRDLSIQTISYMLGFEEQSAFSRYFYRETGIYPSDFRKKSTQ